MNVYQRQYFPVSARTEGGPSLSDLQCTYAPPGRSRGDEPFWEAPMISFLLHSYIRAALIHDHQRARDLAWGPKCVSIKCSRSPNIPRNCSLPGSIRNEIWLCAERGVLSTFNELVAKVQTGPNHTPSPHQESVVSLGKVMVKNGVGLREDFVAKDFRSIVRCWEQAKEELLLIVTQTKPRTVKRGDEWFK